MFNSRMLAMMMAIAGLMGCESERLDVNQKEAEELCKQIEEGKVRGSFTRGENNRGEYGDVAISLYDEEHGFSYSYAFKRNEKGFFDKKVSVRPVIRKKPVELGETAKWVEFIKPEELTR